MKKLLILAALSTISGCGVLPAKNFDGDIPSDRIATFNSKSNEREGRAWFYAMMVAYQPSNSVADKPTVIGSDSLGWPRVLKLTPGKYRLSIRCMTSLGSAYSKLDVIAEAGKNYDVTCSPVNDRVGEIQVIYQEAKRN